MAALWPEAEETEARAEELLGRIPAGRWGEPEALKGAVVFLGSDAAGGVFVWLAVAQYSLIPLSRNRVS